MTLQDDKTGGAQSLPKVSPQKDDDDDEEDDDDDKNDPELKEFEKLFEVNREEALQIRKFHLHLHFFVKCMLSFTCDYGLFFILLLIFHFIFSYQGWFEIFQRSNKADHSALLQGDCRRVVEASISP